MIPEHTSKGLVVLSPTRVELGMRCMRKHSLADTLSQQPSGSSIVPGALEFGTRMHSAAAIYWACGDAAVATEYLRSQPWPLGTKHTLGLALQCWATYAMQAKLMPFSVEEENWDIVAIEERVVLEVTPKLALSFQLDRLVRGRGTGSLCLVDIKTAAKCDARWRLQWPRSLQMKLYAEAVARKYGAAPEWVVIEGMSKENGSLNLVNLPTITPEMRAEAWRAFEWVAYHDAQLLDNSSHSGVIDAEHLVQQVLTRSPFSPAECFSYGAPCPYLPLCDAEPSERIALLREGYDYVEPEWI